VADDIYVSFGPDTGPLEAASARARAEVRSLTSEMNSLGRTMQSTGASVDSNIRSAWRFDTGGRAPRRRCEAHRHGSRPDGPGHGENAARPGENGKRDLGSPGRAGGIQIDVEKFRQLSPVEQMEELAEAISKFADGARKTAAIEAINCNLVEMIPLLNRGGEGWKELERAAESTGVIMSTKDVKALGDTAEASNKLSLAVKALGQDIAIFLNGPIGSAITLPTNLATELDDVTPAARALGTVWGAITNLAGLPHFDGGLDDGIGYNGTIPMHDRNLGAGFGGFKAQPKEMNLGRAKGGGGGSSGSDDAGAVAEDSWRRAGGSAADVDRPRR
jgi:hypothetical protein